MAGPKPSISEGCRFSTTNGGHLTVLEYKNSKEVLVEFDNTKTVMWTNAVQLKRGTVKDKFAPKLFGVGFIGEGDIPSHVGRKETWEYCRWYNMLLRCYSPSWFLSKPAYKGCSVNSDWYNFQTFALWCKGQVGVGEKGWQLDKDILIKGNKEYGPGACCFVPNAINSLLIKSLNSTDRGDYIIGVQIIPKTGRYRVLCHGKHVGVYSTELEAFLAYKGCKEGLVKERAMLWKDKIEPRVFEALLAYQVEITD